MWKKTPKLNSLLSLLGLLLSISTDLYRCCTCFFVFICNLDLCDIFKSQHLIPKEAGPLPWVQSADIIATASVWAFKRNDVQPADTHTSGNKIPDRITRWQSLGGELDQYTWDEGVERTICQVAQGIRGNAWNSTKGAVVSRVFPIKSVNVTWITALLDHCKGEKHRLLCRKGY